MKRNTNLIVFIFCVSIIAISNTPIAQFFIRMEERHYNYYRYSTYDDPQSFFSENPKGSGRLFYFEYRNDSEVVKNNPTMFNYKLYRNFTINPLCFWRWWAYFTDERYTLPYISREDVIKNSEKKKK